jgi:two-component system sensor histidine kinase MprB
VKRPPWAVRRRRPLSFRGRLSVLVAAAVGISVALAATSAFFLVRSQLYRTLDNQLQRQGSSSALQVRFFGGLSYDQVNSGITTNPRTGALDLQDSTLIQLVEGNEVIPGLRGEPVLPVSRADVEVSLGNRGPVVRNVDAAGVSERMITVQAVPGVIVQIAQPLTSINNTLERLRLYLLLTGLTGMVLALIFGDTVARITLRPVKRLTAAAAHVAATQQLDAVIAEDGDDELSRLAHSFNAMLSALSASRQQQAQLVADAGHELRTPLTSLRTNVELLMRGGVLSDVDRAELLSDVHSQLEELTSLVGDLVELAREEEQQPEIEDIDIATTVERALERARRRAISAVFDVSLVHGTIQAQPALLERAVLNVLDNAAKWSPPGGRIEVRLWEDEVWHLTVRDHGPGIADEDLPHIFERFYRASNARAMSGSGLGLAIVRRVVDAQGGSLKAESPGDGGTLISIELPRLELPQPDPAGPVTPADPAGPVGPTPHPQVAEPAPQPPGSGDNGRVGTGSEDHEGAATR